MITEFSILNVKCNGCKNTIIKEARKQDLVISIGVDIESGKVLLEYDGGEETLARVKSRLYRRGYPEKGRNYILSSTKSYVSCAIGRLTKPAEVDVPVIGKV